MRFGSGYKIGLGGGGSFASRHRPIILAGLQHNNAFSVNGNGPADYQPQAEMLEKISVAVIKTEPSGITPYTIGVTAARGLPKGIPAGETKIAFSWAAGGQDAFSPSFGNFVLRHTLDPGTYTITNSGGLTRGAQTTVVVNGVTMTRIEFSVPYPNSNPAVQIAGPVGDFPADWDIQFLRVSDEAAFDNASLPTWHATRRFVPEYLDLITSHRPHHFRFMGDLATFNSLDNSLADYTKETARAIGQKYSIEQAVGLCDHLRMGGWFTLPMAAEDDLIDHWCDFIIANLDDDLPVYIEHGNEHWNGVQSSISLYAAEGNTRFGNQGPGTISFDTTTRVVTGTGVDFTTIFGPSGEANITFGNRSYAIERSQTTATTLQVVSWLSPKLMNDAPAGTPYYYSDVPAGRTREGYVVKSTLAMKRCTDKFTAAGQMGRLTRVYGGHLVNVAQLEPATGASSYWTTPDYLDPMTMHDAVAVTSYFLPGVFASPTGSDDNPFTALVRAAAEAPRDQQAYNDLIVDYALDRPISGVTPAFLSINRVKEHIKTHRDFCDLHGWKLLMYEGGQHMVERFNVGARPTDQDIVDAWYPAFMQSPEALEMFELWRDVQIPYLDGPVNKHNIFGTLNSYSDWGLFHTYDQPETTSLITVTDSLRAMEPYWLPDYPPRAVPVPDQSWTAGANPNFDLKDYVSVNATSFSGTPPAGATLNTSTGVITGAPTTAAAADYTFTATNAAGSVPVVINITVA